MTTIPCKWCGDQTDMLGIKECEGCWEMRSRMMRRPAVAMKILKKSYWPDRSEERFDRAQFDGWSHDEMVDAYVGSNIYAAQLETEMAKPKSILVPMLADVERFLQTVIDLPIPSSPKSLSLARKSYALAHMFEEITEFASANIMADETDALIDLVYVALGRLVEMGIAPVALFGEVHAANMRKERGTVAKRPYSLGHDAVKPPGWTGPDVAKLLRITWDDVELLTNHKETLIATIMRNADGRYGGIVKEDEGE